MADEEDGLFAAAKVVDPVQASGHKCGVPDGQHLVDEQDLGIDVDGDGETEAHVHAARVGFDRGVDEVLEFGETDDLVELVVYFLFVEAEHDAVDEDVFAAGDLGMETGAELDQGAHLAGDRHRALGGFGDAGHEFEEGRFAASVLADDTVGGASGNLEADAVQGRHALVGFEGAEKIPLEEGALEGLEAVARAVFPVDLGDVVDDDGIKRRFGGCPVPLCRHPHTSSGKLSRSLSKT